MEIIYNIGILGISLLGIIHAVLTFKIYKKDDENAYWFFSIGLALIIYRNKELHQSKNAKSDMHPINLHFKHLFSSFR